MDVNGIKTPLNSMLLKIRDEARKRADNGVAVLSEEEVEKIILGAKLEPIEVKEDKQTVEEKKPVRKAETKPEKKSSVEQISIFDL